jgi:hypothetical protein
MADYRYIREIPAASGDGDDFIILDVTSNGAERLDVTLLGSEGQFPYFKQSNLTCVQDLGSVC